MLRSKPSSWTREAISRAAAGAWRGAFFLVLLGGLMVAAVIEGCKDFGSPVDTSDDIGVSSVVVEALKSPFRLRVGESSPLRAEARDAGGAIVPEATFQWSSDNPLVAEVDATGRVTGLGQGSATIRASAGGIESAPLGVTVFDVSSVAIVAPAPPYLVPAGGTIQFRGEARDAAGAILPDEHIGWSSDNTTVASIDSTGRAIGSVAGSTRIRAVAGAVQSAAETLTVVEAAGALASLTIVAPASPRVQVGAAIAFEAVGRDANGVVLSGLSLQWSSDNVAVAEIDANGVALGMAMGTTTIRVASDTIQSDPVQLVVFDVASVVITGPAAPSVRVGGSVRFEAEVRDDQGNVLTGADVAWSSDDTTVARIDATGLATGLAAGTAGMRASSRGISSAAVILTVDSASPDFTTQVQPIFTASCALSGCHAGTRPKEDLSLEPGRAYDEIVNIPSVQLTHYLLVKPGDPQNSMLYLKISGNPPSGSRMPPGGAGLSARDIEIIRSWIAASAPR